MAAVPLAISMLVVTFGRCVLAAVWVLCGRIDVQPQQHSRLRSMLTVRTRTEVNCSWWAKLQSLLALRVYMLLVLVLATSFRRMCRIYQAVRCTTACMRPTAAALMFFSPFPHGSPPRSMNTSYEVRVLVHTVRSFDKV